MAKKLEELSWKSMWTSHIGCLAGCLDYLDLGVSDAWLFGGTGHAFVINVHEALCPSGPTAWKTGRVFELARNLGCEIDVVFAFKSQPGFSVAQRRAFEHVRESIDAGIPCYGWELAVPEYYVINGYEDEGYCISGPCLDPPERPRPWREVGATQIGVLEICSVRPGRAPDDATAVREALAFAVEHSGSPEKWIFPRYKAGPAAFDQWIGALRSNTADGCGTAYNSEVWSECRRYAVKFLKEAEERLSESLAPLFAEAIGHYEAVSEGLGRVRGLFPFEGREEGHIEDAGRRSEAASALETARDAEVAGLEALGGIIEAL